MNDLNFPGWQPEKAINVVTGDGMTRVFVKGQPYMSWPSADEGCLRLAIVQLHTCGLATEEELAAAFGRHVNSVQRYLAEFTAEGMRGLVSERRGPKGPWKITPELRSKILFIVLREGVHKLEAIQQRIAQAWQEEVSVPSIQQVLEENGLSEPISLDGAEAQGELFEAEPERQLLLDLKPGTDPLAAPRLGSSEQPKEAAALRGSDSRDQADVPQTGRDARRHDSPAQRVYWDQLEQGAYNAYAGGLLFAPLLARYDFVPRLRKVITIATYEGYSLEELSLTLFYLDVFGFGSLEDFKRAYPEEFGVLVGRAQSPSLFTLRRFLHKVRKLKHGETLMDEFAVAYLKSELAAWGVMYIDGHFMPYYGMHPISKGWHGVRQMPMKGSYNFLAVDEHFTPWLFLIGSCSEDLLQKIPELIEKAKKLGELSWVGASRSE